MDGINNDRITGTGDYRVYVRGSPTLVLEGTGRVLRLDGGRQYADGGEAPMCGGYLSKCTRGLTLRFRVKPNRLVDNTYFLSSAPYDVYYKDGAIYADFRMERDRWIISSPSFDPTNWNLVEVSWDTLEGLAMYVNGKKVASQLTPVPNKEEYDPVKHFYVGRANTNMRFEQYLDGLVDDVELWEASRTYLLGHGLITGGELGRSAISGFLRHGRVAPVYSSDTG